MIVWRGTRYVLVNTKYRVSGKIASATSRVTANHNFRYPLRVAEISEKYPRISSTNSYVEYERK